MTMHAHQHSCDISSIHGSSCARLQQRHVCSCTSSSSRRRHALCRAQSGFSEVCHQRNKLLHQVCFNTMCALQVTAPHRRAVLLAGSLLAGLLAADLDALAANGTVFVAGAAGKTGKEVVKYLTSKGLSVRAGVRVRTCC